MLLSATGGTSATLGYDPMLRLYQLSPGASTTRFAYDGLDLIAEYDGSNTLLRRHVHGPGADQPLVWYEGSGTTDRRFLGSDERGSIVSVTDGSGTVLSLNSYDEYGIPGIANAGRFQYAGQAWLPELGFQYSKARIYSPTLGRFLQTDPIGVAGGMNLYAYVGNDPVNWIDPLGLEGSGPDITVVGSLGMCAKHPASCVDPGGIAGPSMVGGLVGGENGGPDITVKGTRHKYKGSWRITIVNTSCTLNQTVQAMMDNAVPNRTETMSMAHSMTSLEPSPALTQLPFRSFRPRHLLIPHTQTIFSVLEQFLAGYQEIKGMGSYLT